MSYSNTDVIGAWKDRIKKAQNNAAGLTFEFHTSLHSVDEETKPYHDHAGDQVSLSRLIIDVEDDFNGETFDAEALPFFVGRFSDGTELLCGFEEAFTHDDRLLELKDAAAVGFFIAREMGYEHPQWLAEDASEDEKRRFVELVQSLTFKVNDQTHNTPSEYRVDQDEFLQIIKERVRAVCGSCSIII